MVAHEYGSGSDASTWIAFEAQDVAYAGGPHDRSIDGAVKATTEGEDPDVYGENPLHASTFSFPLTFGCQTSVSGYFEKQLASGVMGMDRKAQSFWGQMRASQVIHRAQFSLCFVKQPIASISGTTAGAVSLGGKDDRLHSTPMVFAKAMGHGATASFKVRVRKMYLRQKGGQSVMFDSNAAIHQLDADEGALNGKEEFNFDSGTTDTYFTKGFSDEFRKVWKDIVGSDYTNDPMPLSDSQLRNLPTILLQMVPHEGGVGDEVRTNNPMEVPGLAGKVDVGTPNDVLFSIPATHYMQHSASSNTYTSRIYLDREDDMGSVLGSNAMMGHDILFDMDAARIGFAESECDYARLVAESGSASNAGGTKSGDSGSKNSVDSSESGSARNSSDSSNVICGSMKCRGLFGVTMSVIFICFFIFARRYITRRDDGVVKKIPRSEFEMKSSVAPRYSDDEAHLSGGERVLSPPPPRYSDRHSRRESEGSDRERGERSSRHISADGSQSSSSRSRDYPRSDGSQRSSGSHRSSRDYPRSDGSQRSSESHHSRGDRIQASGSIQSERSSRSMRSNGSHHSSRSHVSSGSHRSSGTRESHRSHSSHRSSGSRESSRRSLDRHSSDGEYEGRSSRRYRDDYGDSEIPMPPSIS